jgi:hypothetical protein
MDFFKLNSEYYVQCRSENTRYGFRHLAELHRGASVVAHAKCCYYNRTWESYEYQSVINQLLSSYFTPPVSKRYIKKLDAKAHADCDRRFGTIAAVAKIGALLCEKPEEKNNFQKRILDTIPGIDFPDDFDALPEDEKQKRLAGAINTLGGE